MTQWVTIDGNQAVARVAHKLSDVIAIYPITPSSAMAEAADAWSAAGRTNLWGEVPEVIQMQSEAGVAGALHGVVTKGLLGCTFTASQGLLLMIPDMYKIAGELTPAVVHVAARSVATHALSIFGDHSDVMATRACGWAMLSAGSVQEAQDFAAVAHAATLRTRVPFVHFFDGFRTSHEINKIALLSDTDLRTLVREDDVAAHRRRGLTPDAPVLRGTAQNPDVFFQSREAVNSWYDATPGVVQQVFDELAELTGRHYGLVDYHGSPDAERVIVVLGSAQGTVRQTVDRLVDGGERVGMLAVRLYRPFPEEALVAALPSSVRRIAVLDRTKEPGAAGEPLFEDVLVSLAEHADRFAAGLPGVIGGRYGLASKEFTPAMAAAVFAELASDKPRRRFTVGITDDVTHLSLAVDPGFRIPEHDLRAVFFGLGSDGTVGAARNTVTIVGADEHRFAQGYFVYDSRKAGATTVSHLRFADHPIDAPYLIDEADVVGVHQFELLRQMPTLDRARPGALVLLNSPFGDRTWQELPIEVRALITDRHLQVWVVDAARIARQAGLGKRINTVMQTCFFHLSGLLPREEADARIRASVEQTYGRRGQPVVDRNLAAIDAAVAALIPLQAGGARSAGRTPPAVSVSTHEVALLEPPMPALAPDAPPFVREVTAALLRGAGDELPVSALPVDGTWPVGTSKYEKRGLAEEIPIWDAGLCIDCGKCVLVCPQAAIRVKTASPDAFTDAPTSLQHKNYRDRSQPGVHLVVQVAPDDCTGCGICVDICPARSRTDAQHKSLNMAARREHLAAERANYDFFLALPEVDRTAVRHDQVKGAAQLQPLFEFSLACSGCGETPYIRLLTQLFGDRLLIANATGCSSIYGGNLPTTPYTTNSGGRGPAWSNSLFEDNAEFGLGLRLGWERQRSQAVRLLGELAAGLDAELVAGLLNADQSNEAGIQVQRVRVSQLKEALAGRADPASQRLSSLADELVDKTVWIVGGDGWAYDIDFAGLDHVLASGRNVNLLVLDTEVYSNTGGQASKATPRGAVAKFAAAGKASPKKDLGRIAQAYGNVYVAQVAIGANQQQTVRALLEAQAWPGPSLVIAYATCIAHGIDMATSMTHQSLAVDTGYWPLYRFRPTTDAGSVPLHLDSRAPAGSVAEFMGSEARFAMLQRTHPRRAAELIGMAQSDVDERWRYYSRLAEARGPAQSERSVTRPESHHLDDR